MIRSTEQLRADALAIWHAGVNAVRSDLLVKQNVTVTGDELHIADQVIRLSTIGRIVVVGGGKAAAGMAAGLETALTDQVIADKQVTGLVNVPEGCAQALQSIEARAVRPVGINEPTEAAVAATTTILGLVADLTPDDLCICLLSGGGSALLPAPVPEITLADKQAITRHLSAAGANIAQLNTVRKQLSRIKGGGLARSCSAGHLITLIISDVPGDPLDVIASGPTVNDPTTAAEAMAVLDQFRARQAGIAPSVFDYLGAAAARSSHDDISCAVANHIIGNNATAVDACGQEAVRRGYSPAMTSATAPEGTAEKIGLHMARMARHMRTNNGPDCLISGGEPTVELAPPECRGSGGRNQQLVLAALHELLGPRLESPTALPHDSLQGICILSGGTDGEDGPTDAAGAVADADIADAALRAKLDLDDFLTRNDAYHFFEPINGLLKTGPTNTNVCDLRVVLCGGKR